MVTRVAIMKLSHKNSGRRLGLSRVGSRVGRGCAPSLFIPWRSREPHTATLRLCPIFVPFIYMLCSAEKEKGEFSLVCSWFASVLHQGLSLCESQNLCNGVHK